MDTIDKIKDQYFGNSKLLRKVFTDPFIEAPTEVMSNSRFLSGLFLLFLGAIAAFLLIEVIIFNKQSIYPELILIDILAMILVTGLYVLSRFGYYKLSAAIFIIFVFAVTFIADDYGYGILFYLTFTVYIAVFIFSIRTAFSIYLTSILSLLLYYLFTGSNDHSEMVSTIIFNVFMGISIIIYAIHLKNLEEFRTVELKNARERFKGLVENTSAALVIHKNSRIIYANEATKNLFGFTESQLKYKDMTQLFDYMSKDEQGRYLLHTDIGESWGKVHRGKIELDGQELSVTTILDETEIKAYETILIEARDEAERSKDIKEQFLANVSHEIRTPLNGVIGLTRLLEETELTAEQEEYVNGIDYSASHLGEVINDILDLSKANSGKLNIRDREFALSYLLNEVYKHFQNQADEKGLKLLFDVEESLPNNAVGDATRIRQILFNLIGNAIKFTDEGEIILKVESEKLDSDQLLLLLTITDTGVGISTNDIPKIFDSFDRASSNREGTGLGLAISKKLIELMNGSIEVESELDKGSNFYIKLPIRNKESAGGSEIRSSEPKVMCPKILLVEDDRFNQLVTTKLLEKNGYTVDLAVNGKEGIQMSNLNKYCVILMDLLLPDISGIDIAKVIREQSKMNSKTPIIAFSANHSEGELRRSIEVGMNDFVSKPFDASYLLETIKKNLPNKLPTVFESKAPNSSSKNI